jgi:hypothetical protein
MVIRCKFTDCDSLHFPNARRFGMFWIVSAMVALSETETGSPRPPLAIVVERGKTGKPGDKLVTRDLPDGSVQIVQWPYDPLAVKVVLKNVSDKEVRMKFSSDPKACLDFVVRKDGYTISGKDTFGSAFSPEYKANRSITLPPGQTHEFYVNLQGGIAEKHQGPGTYRIWAFFYYDRHIDIYSEPYTVIVSK